MRLQNDMLKNTTTQSVTFANTALKDSCATPTAIWVASLAKEFGMITGIRVMERIDPCTAKSDLIENPFIDSIVDGVVSGSIRCGVVDRRNDCAAVNRCATCFRNSHDAEALVCMRFMDGRTQNATH